MLSAAAALVTAAAAVPAPPAPARRRHRGLISSRGPRKRLRLLAQVREDLAAAAAAARQLQAPGAEAVPEAAQADKRTVHGEPLYDEPQRMPIPGNYKTTEVSDMPDGHMVEPFYIGDELADEDLQAQAAGSAVFAVAAAVDVAEPCSRGLRTTPERCKSQLHFMPDVEAGFMIDDLGVPLPDVEEVEESWPRRRARRPSTRSLARRWSPCTCTPPLM